MKEWLSQLAIWRRGREPRGPEILEGWTEDMTIPLPRGRTEDELVEHIVNAMLQDTPPEVIKREVMAAFELSEADAELALDRTFGGIVRAATENSANSPPREKDPVAWASFQRATGDPSIAVHYRAWLDAD